jgi:hypothetical protein
MKTISPAVRSADDDTVGDTPCAARPSPSAKLRQVGDDE